MKITEIKKDLFKMDINQYCLAQCISLDCKMGKGIAKTFDNIYPKMKKEIYNGIIINELTYPCTILYINEETNAHIYNLITKDKYYNKPTYSSLRETLIQMRKMMVSRKQTKLAMPLIGCGLDRLDWSKVKLIIEDVFKNTDIEIVICKL